MTMHQNVRLALAAVALAALAGCATQRTTTPQVAVGRGTFTNPSPGTYEELDQVTGTSGGGQVLGFIRYGDAPWQPSPPADVPEAGFMPPVSGRAMTAVLNALDTTPQADAILRPRISESTVNFLLWGSWSVKVSGKAISLTSP